MISNTMLHLFIQSFLLAIHVNTNMHFQFPLQNFLSSPLKAHTHMKRHTISNQFARFRQYYKSNYQRVQRQYTFTSDLPDRYVDIANFVLLDYLFGSLTKIIDYGEASTYITTICNTRVSTKPSSKGILMVTNHLEEKPVVRKTVFHFRKNSSENNTIRSINEKISSSTFLDRFRICIGCNTA